MRAYSSMLTSDFVGQLRDIAIKAGARPQVIDCIDDLDSVEDLSADLCSVQSELDDVVKARDQLGLELFILIQHHEKTGVTLSEATKESVQSGLYCLQRHDIYTEETLTPFHRWLFP